MTTLLLLASLAIAALPTHGDGYVNDKTAGMLSAQEAAALNHTLISLRDRTSIEFAVLIVPSLGGEDLRAYSNAVFHAWGLGKKGVDNGVLLVWATQERRVRIEVGRGLEPQLTDGATGDIVRNVIIPKFRDQRWNEGLTNGVAAVIAQLEKPAIAARIADDVPASTHPFPWLPVIAFLTLGGGLGLATWLFFRRRKPDPPAPPTQSEFDDLVASRRSYTRPTYHRDPVFVPVPYVAPSEPSRSYESSSPSSSSSSDWGSSSSSDSSASYSGGDSGGGGADGAY